MKILDFINEKSDTIADVKEKAQLIELNNEKYQIRTAKRRK